MLARIAAVLAAVTVAGCFRTEAPARPDEERPVVVVKVAPPATATASPRSPSPVPASRPPEETAAIRSIQRALVHRGFAPGYPDGRWGPHTEHAFAQFEASAGLEPDGMPDAESLRALFLEEELETAAEIQPVRGAEPPSRLRGFTRTFALGAGVGFLLAALLTAIVLVRQRAAAS